MQDENSSTTNGVAAAAIVVGLALVVLAPLLDLVGAGTRRGFGTGQLLLVGLGLVLMAAGLLVRTARVRRWFRPGWRVLADGYRLAAFAVFNLFLLIAGVELVGWLIDRRAPLPSPGDRGAYYATQPWARQHWQEFELVKKQLDYSPYTLWHTRPFQGETLRIDDRGVRRTLTPTGSNGDATGSDRADADFETVFAFGGSALWGHGAPDDGTLPAFLQVELAQGLERPVRVENLGERGHVATQSLIRLMLELQADRVPDRVVFYHGFNDVAVALAGAVGGHYAETHIANRLERPFMTWLASLRTLLLLRSLLPAPPQVEPLSDGERIELARAIVDNYLGSYRLLDGMSQEYGFEIDCFWQPVQALTLDREAAAPRSARAVDLDRVLAAAYEEVEHHAARLEHLHLLTGVLDPVDDSAWADPVHLTPVGNKLVARAIADVMRARSPR